MHWYAPQLVGLGSLHVPAEQLPAPWSVAWFVQMAAGHSRSGSVAAVMLAQVPDDMPVFANEQALHVAVHEVPQHTPSTQKPEKHSAGLEHASPVFCRQSPFLQKSPPLSLHCVPSATGG